MASMWVALFGEAAARARSRGLGLVVMLGSVYLVARVVAWSSIGVALRPWRRAAASSWVERARLAWPARRIGRIAPLVIAVFSAIALWPRRDPGGRPACRGD